MGRAGAISVTPVSSRSAELLYANQRARARSVEQPIAMELLMSPVAIDFRQSNGTDLTFGARLPGENPAETLRSDGYHLLEFDH